jgi:alginate O-acetyltransferase complex protein AlgI
LSSLFRDYLYIPLGGNKNYYYRNLFIVWFLTGIWHGASWNFILWGLYFGVLIALEKLIISRLLNKTFVVFKHIYALFFIVVGWVLFQFTSFDKMSAYLGKMFWESNVPISSTTLLGEISKNSIWLAFTVLLCFPVFDPANENGKRLMKKIIPFQWMKITISLSLLLISTALLAGKSYNPFIYFRF